MSLPSTMADENCRPAVGRAEFSGPYLQWMHLSPPLVVLLIIGLAASIVGHLTAKEWDVQARTDHFERLAHEQTEKIKSNILATVATLRSIRGLFDASNAVDRAEFRTFVRSIDVDGSVQALEWIPRVTRADRADFEQAAIGDGFGDFQFSERTGEGDMARASDRSEYFPVYFVEPYIGNERALGFDLGSNATRLAALNDARASGQEVATARITLVQESGAQYGFLIFTPVYRGGETPDTREERVADLAGFGLGVFRVGDLVSSALTQREGATAQIAIHVFDRTAPAGKRLLYPKSSSYQDVADLRDEIRAESALRFAGREWQIVATPVEGSVFTQASNTPWAVLLLGITISILATLCFSVVIGRSQYANHLVTVRTAELVHANEHRDRLLQKLSRTNEELESFAYVASHDLKAPLRGIDNLITWIIEDDETRLSDESQHNAGRMRIRVKRLEALLDGLLDYSRAGRLQVEVDPVDTGQLCDHIAEDLAAHKGFAITIAPDMPQFETVKVALETVLRNLIGNAVNHHDGEKGNVVISAEDRGRTYRFTVRDDGPGIDPTHHEKVFEIFQSLAPRRENGRSGIGLSIVKRLVEAAGGSIQIESDNGERGTAIHFTWHKSWPTDGDMDADNTG